MRKKIIIRINILAVFFYFMLFSSAWAAFTLSVSPREGGNNLRFGRVDTPVSVNKEVTIRITSTESTQYHIFQRVISPFRNEKGETLDTGILTSYTMRGSNATGALYQEESGNLSLADQLLYTSNANGDSDSFRIFYTLNADRLNIPGNFWGKIIYTLQPIAGGEQKTYVFDIYFEASLGEFKIELNSSSGRNRIRLGTERDKDKESYLEVSFQGNRQRGLKIYQETIEFPQNEFKNEICQDCILLFASGGSKGELQITSPSGLERKRTLLYTSDEPKDIFTLHFALDPLKISSQPTGNYRGRLVYTAEGFGIEKSTFLDLEINVIPVFKLEVTPPLGGLRFADVTPDSPPLLKEVVIKVDTNLRKPYIVTQNVASTLINQEGRKIAPKFFTMKEELIDEAPGSVSVKDFASVSLGESSLFFSDDQGSPGEFKVSYKLTPNLGIAAGEYSTMVTYSLGER